MIRSILLGGRNQRGMIFALTIMILMVLALLTTALLGFGLNERTAASSQLLTARAFFAAEAGVQRAYYILTNASAGTVPGGWTGTGCGATTPWNCRTTGYTESLPSPPGDSFTLTVQDGPGTPPDTVVITSTATVGGHTRKVQMVIAGTGGSLSTNAIRTPQVVQVNGTATTVNGTIAGTLAGSSPTINCNAPYGSGPPCTFAAPSGLPKVGFNGLRTKAKSLGYYFKGTVTKDASAHCPGSAIGVCDSQSTPHCACLPTTLTTTGVDTTGTVNVVFIDNSDFPANPSTTNDGSFNLSGNYTLGGFIISMGANPSAIDESFGGTPTVNGVVYSLGDVKVHGCGGSDPCLVGGLLSNQGATLDGNPMINYDATKMARAGQIAFSPLSWTELNP